jgi:hypothetical protein
MGWNSYYISKPTGAGESFFLIYFSYWWL